MLLSCVNWRHLLRLGFPRRRGIFIGAWHRQWTGPRFVTPTNIIVTLYSQKLKNVSNLRRLQRLRLHGVCFTSLSVCLLVFAENLPVGGKLLFWQKKEQIQIRENRSRGKGWRVSTSGIPKPIRAVKEWKQEKKNTKKDRSEMEQG